MSKSKKFILVAISIILALLTYWDLKTWEPCGENTLEDDQDIEGTCVVQTLEKAKKGDKAAIFLYTRHLEMTFLNEISSDATTIADAILKQSAPSKLEYLHWLRIAATNGNPHYIRTVLDFCQAGIPSFDASLIQQIFESPQRKIWYSDPNPKWRDSNRSELRWIEELEQDWREGKFSPCKPNNL